MKIFLDTANIDAIEKLLPTHLVDGVTTNPSLLAKEGGNPAQVIHSILSLLPQGLVSVEVTEKDPNAIYIQARNIAALSSAVLVKIPCHEPYYPVIARLVRENIALNITLVFSLSQALMMAKLGVRYISPFVGRLDDHHEDSKALLSQLRAMIDRYHFTTGILAASIRTVQHVTIAVQAGADAITVPPAIFTAMMHHTLTDAGIARFDADWQALSTPSFF